MWTSFYVDADRYIHIFSTASLSSPVIIYKLFFFTIQIHKQIIAKILARIVEA